MSKEIENVSKNAFEKISLFITFTPRTKMKKDKKILF